MPPTSEVKVIIVGNRGAGKTTVLNCLMPSDRGNSDAPETTVSVRNFMVDWKSKLQAMKRGNRPMVHRPATKRGKTASGKRDNGDRMGTIAVDDNTSTIKVDHPLFGLSYETDLVVVDTPGYDLDTTNAEYIDHIRSSWSEYDCVIVVIDAACHSCVRDMAGLLSLVQHQRELKKDMPIIVLCNKVDDPMDRKTADRVISLKREVEQMFNVSDRDLALKEMLSGAINPSGHKANPCFVSVSAKNALPYTRLGHFRLHESNPIDNALLRKLESRGDPEKIWETLTETEKEQVLFKIVNHPHEHLNRTDKSNFMKFQRVVGMFITRSCAREKDDGENDALPPMLSEWLLENDEMVDHLERVHKRNTALGFPTSHIIGIFWVQFQAVKEKAFGILSRDVKEVSILHTPMWHLVRYATTIHKTIHSSRASQNVEYAKIVSEMINLVRCQIRLVRRQETIWVPLDPDHFPSSYLPRGWKWKRGGWYNEQSREYFPGSKEMHPANRCPDKWEGKGSGTVWHNTISGCVRSGDKSAIISEMEQLLSLPTIEEYSSDFFNMYSEREIECVRVPSRVYPEDWKWRDGGWKNDSTDAIFLGKRDEHPANFFPDLWEWVESEKVWYNSISNDKRKGRNDINPSRLLFNWESLAPADWETIISCILTLQGNKFFYDNFALDMRELQMLARNGRFTRPEYCYKCKVSTCSCEKIGQKYMAIAEQHYDDDVMGVPFDALKLARKRRIHPPEDLKDPEHWGHLGWMFVKFMESGLDIGH